MADLLSLIENELPEGRQSLAVKLIHMNVYNAKRRFQR